MFSFPTIFRAEISEDSLLERIDGRFRRHKIQVKSLCSWTRLSRPGRAETLEELPWDPAEGVPWDPAEGVPAHRELRGEGGGSVASRVKGALSTPHVPRGGPFAINLHFGRVFLV